MELTARQSEVLDFIRRRVETRGAPPSLREIMDHFGFASPATVSGHLELLERKGAIRREPGRARNIILPGSPARRAAFLEIPIYGAIPAGLPQESEVQADRCVAVDMDSLKLPRGARVFALEVRGDSMTGAGILDRDIVILELAEPRHRDIVAALIDGETTLKRFLLRQGRPFLRAENPAYPDLVPAGELVIQGVMRALLRTIPR